MRSHDLDLSDVEKNIVKDCRGCAKIRVPFPRIHIYEFDEGTPNTIGSLARLYTDDDDDNDKRRR